MTLSHLNRNRTFAHGTTLDFIDHRSKRLIRLAAVSAVTALVSVGGFAATDVAAHHDDSCFPVNQNTRSIQLIESKEAPVVVAGNPALPAPYHYRDATHVPESLQGALNAARLAEMDLAMSQNARSIQLIESKEAPVITADDNTLPDFVVDQNRRSILLIEGLQTPNAVANDESLPDLAVDQNRRSILLIESKEAPLELAQPGP